MQKTKPQITNLHLCVFFGFVIFRENEWKWCLSGVRLPIRVDSFGLIRVKNSFHIIGGATVIASESKAHYMIDINRILRK